MVELMILSPLIYTLVFVCLFGFYTYTQHLWIQHQLYQALICMASESSNPPLVNNLPLGGLRPLLTQETSSLKGFASSGKAPRSGFTSQKERSKKRVTARNPRSGGLRPLLTNPLSSLKKSHSTVIPSLVNNPPRGCEGEMRRRIKALLLVGKLTRVKFKKGASKWSGSFIWKTKFWQIPYKKTLTLKKGKLL